MSLSRFILPYADVGAGIRPSSGAQLFFLETGTGIPKDTFNCPDGTTANSNPVISDSKGLFPDIFIFGTYKVILQDNKDVQIWEADPVVSSTASEIQSIARSLNVQNDQVIFSTDTVTVLDNVLFIYDAAEEVIYAKPAGVTQVGEKIVSTAGNQLTTDKPAVYTMYLSSDINPYTMTLAEAKANPYAKEGDFKEISDRGNGKFETVSSITFPANGSTIIAHDTLSLSYKLVKVNGHFTDRNVGLVSGGADQLANIQAAHDYMETGDTFELLNSDAVYTISGPLSLMANVDWKPGYNALTARSDLSLIHNDAKIQFRDDVAWTAAWPDMPIEIKPAGFETSVVRQPSMLTVGSLDNFVIDHLNLDGNMQARGTNIGFPGALEQEHCLKLISCYSPVVTYPHTMNSMGDGINIGYPYLGGEVGPSQFRGVNSLDGLCRNPVIMHTQHDNHSRLGISVVGCLGGFYEDLKSKLINSITNYTSAAGPGATIDFEYDTSNSFPDSLGFSFVDGATVMGVLGEENSYGGAIQVQNGRNIKIYNVKTIGASLFGWGRIEGNADSTEGAKNVTVDGIEMSGAGNCGMYCRLSGEENTILNLNIHSGLTFANGFNIPDNTKNLKVRGGNLNVIHNDSTGSLLTLPNGNVTASFEDVEINVDITSAGIRNPILFNGAAELELKGFAINADDTVAMSGLGRGAIHCNGTGAMITGSDVRFNFKTQQLISQASNLDVNAINLKNSSMRGCIIFPTNSAISDINLDGFEVESCYNDGSLAAAMLYLALKSDQSIILKRISSDSTGKYGFNKTKNGGRIVTGAADFATLTNVSVVVDGLDHLGGRDTDGEYSVSAFANGVNVITPWSVPAIRDLFTISGVRVNSSKSARATLSSGSVAYDINLGTAGNFALYPNAYAVMTPVSSDAGGSTFYTLFATSGAFTQPASIRVVFSAALASDFDMLITTL